MLSRIAESLFWIGRYVERAEDTARILDVHANLLLEDPWIGEEASCAALLEVMGMGDVAVTPSARTVTEVLAYDETGAGSILGSLRRARENARAVRDTISSEMWECLNATWLDSGEQRSAAGTNPLPFFRFVKARTALFAGLADATMSRDEAWRFLTLGRSLERVDMTCRLLSARWADAAGTAGWVTTLSCCAAHEAYLRTYRRAVDTSLAAEFLLLDRLFPRSVYHALSTAERRLEELAPASGRAGPHDDARRVIGLVRTELEFRSVEDLLPELATVLGGVQAGCARAGAAVAARYFHHTAPTAWTA